MQEPEWLRFARQYIGLKEIKGSKHEPKIIAMLSDFGQFNGENKAWWHDDETAWCGTFVGYCLGKSKRYVIDTWFRAKDWANSDVMTKLDKPAVGAIAVLSRSGGGHVGFVVGQTASGQICLLGGNQNDSVNISAFDKSRIVGYYYPSKLINSKPVKSRPFDERYKLPVINVQKSSKES